MTIQFFIFTISIAKNKRERHQALPGYKPTAEDQWLDRKTAFSRYM